MCAHCEKTEINKSCQLCGTIKYPPDFVPYTKLSPAHDHKRKRLQYKHEGECWNCLRPDLHLHRGLCGACRAKINGRWGNPKPPEGSTQFFGILTAYRERRWPDRFRDGKVLEEAA
jgi:hypothetical protein